VNDEDVGSGNEEQSGNGPRRSREIGTAVAPREEAVEIAGPLPHGFALSRPLVALVSVVNDEYVADIAELNLYAFGASREQALRNVQARIVERYRRLDELSDRLSPPAEELARTFRSLVLPRRA